MLRKVKKLANRYKNNENKNKPKISPENVIKVYESVMCQDLDALMKDYIKYIT